MEINGYEAKDKENDNLLTLKEATFVVTLGELDKLIHFLQYVKNRHVKSKYEGVGYTHYRDWDSSWQKGSPDIVVVSNLDEE